MFILDINKRNGETQRRKTIVIYLILSVTAIVIDKVYGIFSHGVDSKAMTWMFLYPFIGGALFYFIIESFMPHITRFAGYRIFLNIYNSGIATLTLASLLKGIFEIAGTNSPFLQYFFIIGGAFLAAGLVTMVIMVINYNKINA